MSYFDYAALAAVVEIVKIGVLSLTVLGLVSVLAKHSIAKAVLKSESCKCDKAHKGGE